MEGELLIDLNESAKRSVSERRDLIGSNLDEKEIKSLLDLGDFLGGAPNTNYNSTPNAREKCILHTDAAELMSPFGRQTKGITQRLNLDVFVRSNHAGLISPFGCSKVDSAQNLNFEFLMDSDASKLMSPFGCPKKCSTPSIASEFNLQNKVPTGELLQVQEEPKLPDDMFDVAVLEKKQTEATTESENSQYEKMNKLPWPSIPSIGSGESMLSSDGTINKGFMELSSNIGSNDLFPTADDSVFEEAQALSEEFSKLAMNAPSSPLEGIENEDINIVYSCPDWDDMDIENIEIQSNHDEIKKLMDFYAKEKENEERLKEINGTDQKSTSSLTSEVSVPNQVIGTRISASSTSPTSPLPLSTHRLDRMRLKATEAIGAPLNFAPLKVNASNRSSTQPARGGPMKAFIPLGQIVKRKLSSPITSISAKSKGTPQLKITESSPPVTKERNSCIGMMSSTPKISKPNVSSGLTSAVRKRFSGSNQKILRASKVHPEATSTPSRPRTSSFGRIQGTAAANMKAPAIPCVKKVPVASPLPHTRYSTGSPATKAPVVRSSSTGHLPLTPSLKKINSSPQFKGFQSPLKRSNSLSTKLSQRSPSRPLASTCTNSPAKQSTPLDKLMFKFRRNSVSRGMKENISPA